jgi:dienelactone hydrolase
MQPGRVLIGTSGYVYRDWRRRFYPRDVPAREWLPFYAARFPTVELNSPFYRLPRAATFRAWGRDLPSPFERTAEIHCPLQGHFGADDANPSPQDVGKLDAELAKFNKPHEFYSYSNAGHAFMDSTKESYRRDADAASWPRTLEFLRRHLGA